jgi:hypothetical protein
METTKADFCVFARVRNSVIASCEALLHRPPGPKFGCQERARGVYPNILATGEHVNCRVAILRPYVDRKMRFRDDDHARDPARREFVEHRVYDRRPGDTRGIHERLLDPRYVVEATRFAFVQVEHDLRTKHRARRSVVCRRGKRRMSRHVSGSRSDLEPTRTIA